jgi:hypothetical protein
LALAGNTGHSANIFSYFVRVDGQQVFYVVAALRVFAAPGAWRWLLTSIAALAILDRVLAS